MKIPINYWARRNKPWRRAVAVGTGTKPLVEFVLSSEIELTMLMLPGGFTGPGQRLPPVSWVYP